MIIVALILILSGSFTGAIILWLHDAPLWQIALGYVGGGWAGLLVGLPVMLLARRVAELPLRASLSRKRARQHQ